MFSPGETLRADTKQAVSEFKWTWILTAIHLVKYSYDVNNRGVVIVRLGFNVSVPTWVLLRIPKHLFIVQNQYQGLNIVLTRADFWINEWILPEKIFSKNVKIQILVFDSYGLWTQFGLYQIIIAGYILGKSHNPAGLKYMFSLKKKKKAKNAPLIIARGFKNWKVF